mmetsp:Transcript_35328/g.43607  ORF Transcript_35328/g.43607 Transcript_35328/m.43607 type:complete len:543 (+) Transcript_35328:439-2067(+)
MVILITSKKRVCFSIVFIFYLVTETCAQASGRRPNIIFILADDMGIGDTSVPRYKPKFTITQIQTPNLERLASNGLLFTKAYASSSVCGPSRSSILLGRHTGRSLIRGNTGKMGKYGDFALPNDRSTFVEILRKAGYYTALIGKWGFGGHSAIPPSHPLDKGFDKFFGQLTHEDSHIFFPDRIYDNTRENKRYDANLHLPKNERASEERCTSQPESCEFIHDLYTEEAVSLIKQRTNKENPFFLFLSYTAPHVGSWDPEPEGQRLGFAARVRKVAPRYVCPRNMYIPPKTWKIDECRHRSVITNYLDRDIGVILDLVEEQGIAGNTLIIFTADNGPNGKIRLFRGGRTALVHNLKTFKSTAGQRGGKRDLFEGGTRTPFIVQWKGKISPSSRSSELVSLTDLYSTFLSLAGAASTSKDLDNDSISLVPTLLGMSNKQEHHQYLHFEYCDQQSDNWAVIKNDPNERCSWAVRRNDGYKLMYDHNLKKTLLFNLNNDPSERRNLALFASNRRLIDNLQSLYKISHVPLQDVGYHGQTIEDENVK